MPRPNLVLVMPDQLRADAVGCFNRDREGGDGGAVTPHIDALAARGTRFTQAFSQHSVCGPSRASIFSGWYPHVAGHRTLDNLLKPWEPNLLRLCKDAGYHVAWAGMRGDTFAPGVTTASTDFAGYLVKPRHRSWPNDPRPDEAWPRLAAANTWYGGRRTPRDSEEDVLDIDEATIRTCEQLLAGTMPEPWLLFVALVFPHPPFAVEDPWWSMHDRRRMAPPSPSLLDDKPRFKRAMREAYGLEGVGTEEWAELKATYYGMVSRVDDQVGRLVDAVDLAGASGRTSWMFFTDHGEYLGDHGLVEKWPAGLDDCLLRNPLIVASADDTAATGRACDELVELVDLLPTISDLGEVPVAHSHFGRSLVPLLEGSSPTTPHRDAAFSEGGHCNDEPHVLEMVTAPPYAAKAAIQQEDPSTVGKATAVRTARWTYVHRLYEGDELYDRVADPSEVTNLAGRADVADVERELRNRVLDWLVATSDVVPWVPDPRFPTT